MRDLAIVIHKELRELLILSTPRTIIWRVLGFVAFIGVVFPLNFGQAWLTSPFALYYWAWFSCLLIVGPAANAINRERRLGTLEAILVSRLSDGSICFGKIISCIIYAYSMVLISIFAGWVTINLYELGDRVMLYYAPDILWGGLIISLLIMIITGGICFLITMKVRDAQKILQIINLVIFVLIIPGILACWIPYPRVQEFETFIKSHMLATPTVLIVFISALSVIACLVMVLVRKQFSRIGIMR